MGASKAHMILYSVAGCASVVHVVFAGLAVAEGVNFLTGVIDENRSLSRGEADNSSYESLRDELYTVGIVRCVVSLLSAFYYFSHLMVRPRKPESLYVSTGMDLGMNFVILVATAVVQWAAVIIPGEYYVFPILDFIFWGFQMTFAVAILIFEVVCIVKKKKRREVPLTRGKLLRTSFDNLVNGTTNPFIDENELDKKASHSSCA